MSFIGEYIGFTYNNIHSSTLGIARVSGGSRFNENLLPTIQDKTVQVPGGDGTYYFGSYYTQKQFSMSFAFDSLTEQQLAEIKRVFGDKEIHDLIFDETPYKVYRAKVTGTATIKHLPFDEGTTHRVYKGEGTIQFTCYEPFARCWSKTNTDYYSHPAYGIKKADGSYKTYNELSNDEKAVITPKIAEWWNASRITSSGNFGDVPVSFIKTIGGANGRLNITKLSNNLQILDKFISWSNLPTTYIHTETVNGAPTQRTCSARAILNTRTGIVKQQYEHGTNDWRDTGAILNKYFTGDLTAKIPVEGKVLQEDMTNEADVTFTCLYF